MEKRLLAVVGAGLSVALGGCSRDTPQPPATNSVAQATPGRARVGAARAGQGAPKSWEQDEIFALAFAPNGRWLAVARTRRAGDVWQGVLEVWDARSRRKVRSWVAGERLYDVAFAPDSRSVAIASHSGVQVWTLDGHKKRGIPDALGVEAAAFSPDGKLLLVCGEQQLTPGTRPLKRDGKKSHDDRPDTLYWHRLADGQTVRRLTMEPESFTNAVDVSPDGRLVAISATYSGPAATVWSLSSGQRLLEFGGGLKTPGQGGDVAFADGGRVLLLAASDGLHVMSALSGPGLGQQKRILGRSAADDLISRDVSVAGPVAAESYQRQDSKGNVHSGGIRLWNWRSGRLLRKLHAEGPVALSPDGTLLASAQPAGPGLLLTPLGSKP